MTGSGIKGWKRSIVLILTAAFVLPLVLNGFGGNARQVEAQTVATRYFYNQLTEKERPFYEAMEQMLASGMLKTGTENYDLTANNLVSQEDLASYANGYPDLLDWMGAARDAFYFDHPDIFYVDFSALSLRVTRDQSGKYHAYLGTGRRDNYFNEAFTSKDQVEAAIAEYEAKINEIVTEAKNLKVDANMDLTRAQITWVHNYITKNTSYRLENDSYFANNPTDNSIYLIRTAYGSLVRGKSVCEGYSRAMKAILDRLGIPCVLVQGVYLRTADQPELHMWNYVQLDGQWYGLDSTMDDPIGDGKENTQYLLVGDDIMSARHVPSGVVSAADREFQYPTLIFMGEEYQEIQNTNGLVVEYKTDIFEDVTSGFFRVSYHDMGYAEAAKNGKYILARYYQYVPGKNENDPEEYRHTEWFYADPSIYQINILQEPDALILPLPQCIYVEFAVTDIAPNLPDDISNFDPDKHSYYFQGDPLLFEAQSKLIYNPEGTYVAPPYPQTFSPGQTSRMVMEQSYNMSITYNDRLIPVEGETPWYQLTSTGPTAVQYSKVENFKWDGDRTITFRFTPSKMYADESIIYYFNFTGLVGEISGKPPIEMSYAVSTGICAHGCSLIGDYNWKLFGQPSLLENSDLSMSNWETSEGDPVSDLLKDRIALVVTSPSSKQEASMNELIAEENGGHEVLSSATYNISLTVCKSMVVKTGQSLKVSVGFPEGYGPEDEGVTFKAYHFKRNAAGEVIDIEEINCVVTKFGLIITCDSFSPFAVVVVEGAEKTTERTAILSSSFGGQIAVNNQAATGLLFLKEGDTVPVTVTAREGYYVERITVGGKQMEGIIPGQEAHAFTLRYSDLQNGSNIIDVQFVAASVQKKETEKGETLVQPVPEAIVVPDAGSTPGTTSPAPPTPSQGSNSSGNSNSNNNRNENSNDNDDHQSNAGQLPVVTVPSSSIGISSNKKYTSKVGAAKITMAQTEATLKVGEKLILEPFIELPVGINSYQWYKDETALSGQTSDKLTIESVSLADTGKYYLVITSTVASSTYEAISDIFTLTVQEEALTGSSASETSDTSMPAEETNSSSLDTNVNASSSAEGSDNSRLHWYLLPIFVLCAAAGVGICYLARKRIGIDSWTDDWV